MSATNLFFLYHLNTILIKKWYSTKRHTSAYVQKCPRALWITLTAYTFSVRTTAEGQVGQLETQLTCSKIIKN